MDRPQFVYPSIHRWTFVLVPPLDCCEYCCCEHLWTQFHVEMFSILLGNYSQVELWGLMVTVFHLLRSCGTLPKQLHGFAIPSAGVWGFQSLHILSNTCYICLFDYGHPGGCEVMSHCDFDLCFPNNQWCWTSFHVLLGHLWDFREMSVQILAHFKMGLFVFILFGSKALFNVL